MKVDTFRYQESTGWSRSPFPEWDSEQTLLVVFGAPEYRDAPERIQEVVDAFPSSHIIGCSTSGEIFDTDLRDGTLAVAAAQFEGTTLARAEAEVACPSDSYAAGQSIAKTLNRPSLRGVLLLSDGLQVNGSELVGGVNSVLPESVSVTGGLAGDREKFKETWVLKAGVPASGFVTAVGFYGDRIRLGHASRGGWDIFGQHREVTKSEGAVLYELDGRPALDLYRTYLGDRADGLPATGLLFPLSVQTDPADEKKLVRTILAIDEEQKSITFAGNIPQGSFAQLMRSNSDRLIEGAAEAARKALSGGETNALCLAISCVGRRLVLGERTEEEIEAVLELMPESTKQIGFYSYGEICPFSEGHCDLHNQTMTLTTISEDESPTTS